MYRRLKNVTVVVVIVGMLAGGLSAVQLSNTPNSLQTLLRNLTAAQCDNQQSSLSNMPLGILTQAQAEQLLSLACAGVFGTAPAPTPAPGNVPAIPGASSAPTPAAKI